MKIAGKRALVTGGAVRIGRALVEALQASGVEVVVHYRESAAEARALSPFVVQADLAVPDGYAGLLEAAGPVDILVNNAALFTRDRLAQSTPERVLREFGVNLFAPIELTRQFTAQAEQGVVINLLDRRIEAHDRSCLPYTLAKRALADFTRLAALELAPAIRVNGVAPGPILPPPGFGGADFREQAGTIPLDTIPQVGEIAAAALFLVDSPSITGQIVFVDGGQHLLGNGV